MVTVDIDPAATAPGSDHVAAVVMHGHGWPPCTWSRGWPPWSRGWPAAVVVIVAAVATE
jgi:hypothetical protein